jgi:large subunit ribosomal protein L6
MSRIGKMPITIPDNVKFSYESSIARVEGPKGKLEKRIEFSGTVKTDGDQITIIPGGQDKASRARYGLIRSLLNSMVMGVTEGFSKNLKIVGVGYKAQLQGKMLQLNLGYSHPVKYPVPDGVKIEVPDPNTVTVSGVDKQVVGQCAAEIRKFREPEPYKGKGVMYSDEHIRRKAGKASVK